MYNKVEMGLRVKQFWREFKHAFTNRAIKLHHTQQLYNYSLL